MLENKNKEVNKASVDVEVVKVMGENAHIRVGGKIVSVPYKSLKIS